VIATIGPSLPIYSGLAEAQERLTAADSSGNCAFPPPSGFHMTVREGLCDQVRTPEFWLCQADLQLPLVDLNQFVVECFAETVSPVVIQHAPRTGHSTPVAGDPA
jgi:hypothetical protein